MSYPFLYFDFFLYMYSNSKGYSVVGLFFFRKAIFIDRLVRVPLKVLSFKCKLLAEYDVSEPI